MEADEETGKETVNRFSLLVRQARLNSRLSRRPSTAFAAMQKALDTEEQVVAYAGECLSREVHKHAEDKPPIFSPVVQARLEAMGTILDKHIDPGPDAPDRRLRLLERAEEFASFSPHHDGNDETNDNEEIADALNEREALRPLPRYLLNRELGLHMRPHALAGGPDRDFTGGPDHVFTAEQAREMVDELGHLQEVLRNRCRGTGSIFVDNRDRVPFAIPAMRTQLDQVEGALASMPPDRTLQRITERQEQEKRRRQRAPSDGFGESSDDDRTSGKRQRGEDTCKDDSRAAGPSAKKRARLDERPKRSSGGER
jgi:hypothetical protein